MSTAKSIVALTEELAALREEIRQLRMAQGFNARIVYVPQPYPVYPQPYVWPWYQQQPYQQPYLGVIGNQQAQAQITWGTL